MRLRRDAKRMRSARVASPPSSAGPARVQSAAAASNPTGHTTTAAGKAPGRAPLPSLLAGATASILRRQPSRCCSGSTTRTLSPWQRGRRARAHAVGCLHAAVPLRAATPPPPCLQFCALLQLERRRQLLVQLIVPAKVGEQGLHHHLLRGGVGGQQHGQAAVQRAPHFGLLPQPAPQEAHELVQQRGAAAAR